MDQIIDSFLSLLFTPGVHFPEYRITQYEGKYFS